MGGRGKWIHISTHATNGGCSREELGVVVINERLAVAVKVADLCSRCQLRRERQQERAGSLVRLL